MQWADGAKLQAETCTDVSESDLPTWFIGVVMADVVSLVFLK